MQPGKGVIARCSKGALGLITEDAPVKVRYANGEEASVWVGIQLSWLLSEPGLEWSSRNPKVIGHISPIIMEYEMYKPVEV